MYSVHTVRFEVNEYCATESHDTRDNFKSTRKRAGNHLFDPISMAVITKNTQNNYRPPLVVI